jgi:hypothetical protein
MQVLSRHSQTSIDIARQGLALLFSILANDESGQLKFNMSRARQMAMANGAVEVLQGLQREYKADATISVTSQSILNTLMTDYS